MLKSNSAYSELKKIKDREGIHILYAIRACFNFIQAFYQA